MVLRLILAIILLLFQTTNCKHYSLLTIDNDLKIVLRSFNSSQLTTMFIKFSQKKSMIKCAKGLSMTQKNFPHLHILI